MAAIDPLLELDDEHRVAGGDHTEVGHASARSSFWWMPPNPPFDMTTTRSPARCSRDDRADDVVDRLGFTRRLAAAVEVAHELRHRQPLGLRQRRSEDGRDDHFVCAGERAREVVLEHPPARRRRARLEHRPDAGVRVRRAQAGQRLGDRGRMVREVVVHRDAVRRADHLEPPLDAGERPQPLGDALGADAHLGRDGDRRERVAHVVRADAAAARSRRTARRRAARRSASRRRPARGRAPASPRPRRARTSATRERAAATRSRARGLSAPTTSRPRRGTRLTSRRNASDHGVEVGVDVRVVELDVVDDGDVRQVLQELRRLVEERAVVLVALDHEVAPLPHPVARRRARRSCARCRRRARSDRRRRAVSSHPVSDVVVVLPCVPAMTIERAPQRKCSRIASGSEQYRILRSSTSSSSGLPREMALPTTTRSRSPVMCSAR